MIQCYWIPTNCTTITSPRHCRTYNLFLASMNDLFDYTLKDFSDSEMVGLSISNQENVQDKAIGLSFRRKDQLTADVISSVFQKVTQSNSRFNALDKLVLNVHAVKLPVCFGGDGIKSRGRPLNIMARLKTSFVQVKAETNCLAHAVLIAKARVDRDPNYESYRKGDKIRPEVQYLLEETGINLDNGGEIPELIRFQEHFSDYKIVVYTGLYCDSIMFEGGEGQSLQKRLNLLYDDVTRHYHVIANRTGAMAKRYVCTACNKGCNRDVTHVCDHTCSDCMTSPPCVSTGTRIPCDSCNRHFRSDSCFEKHKNRMMGRRNKKSVCELKRNCSVCSYPINSKKT
jgi:hypothetical protein